MKSQKRNPEPITKPDHLAQPTAEYRYFLYLPGSYDLIFFHDIATRAAFATGEIQEHLQEEWSEDVTDICAGEVTHMTEETNRVEKPTDPDGIEEWENGPYGDCDYTCNFELLPLTQEGE